MDWAALFKIFQSWGPSAISSVLVVVVAYLIKQVNKAGEDNTKRAKGFQEQMDSRFKEMRENTARVRDEHGSRISNIELEYVRRDTFYRELGGWKDDINRLSDGIAARFAEFNKSLIELWKGKKD